MYGKTATGFDSMAYSLAANNLWDISTDSGILDPVYSKSYAQLVWESDKFSILSQPLNFSGISGYRMAGEILGDLFFPAASQNLITNYISSSFHPVDLHSASLLVIWLAADQDPTGLGLGSDGHGTTLTPAIKFATYDDLFTALFDDSIANLIDLPGGTSTPSEKLRAAIAYSAIAEGERPFGDTAIRAMFDDIAELSFLNVPILQALFGDKAAGLRHMLTDMVVQFAGQLAFGDVTTDGTGVDISSVSDANSALQGILSLNGDYSALTIDLSAAKWSLGANYSGIIHQSEINSLFSTASDGSFPSFDRITLATKDASLISTDLTSQKANSCDLIVGQAGSDDVTIYGGTAIVALGAGNDSINLNGGTYYADGGAGIDSILVDFSTTSQSITWNLITDSYSGPGRIKGFEHLVQLSTGSGDDSLTIGAGLTGNSFWYAGGGNDRLTVDLSSATDFVTAIPAFGVIGLGESNYGRYATSIIFDSVESFNVSGGSASDNLMGAAGDDTLNGNGGIDYLYGEGGNDTLNGGADDDTINTGTGIDQVDGGAGRDQVNIDRSTATSDLSFNAVAAASAAGTGLGDGSTFKNVEIFGLATGSGNDTLIAGAGLTGQNFWYAGDGNDRLTVDLSRATDVVTANLQFAEAKIGIGPGDNNRNYLTQITAYNVESFNVSGGSANDSLAGGSGDDTLNGNAGDDILEARGGKDNINGGAGNDTIEVGTSTGVFDGGSDQDYVSIVHSAATANLTFDAVAAASAAGSNLGDGTTIKNVEGFYLETGSGDDTLFAGKGLNGFNYWYAGGGNDRLTVDLSWTSEAVTMTQRNWGSAVGIGVPHDDYGLSYTTQILVTGVESFNASGGSGNDYLEGLYGDDILNGNGGDDTLNGGSGKDILDGGTGADYMTGGPGDDTFIVDNAGDQAIELSGQGYDTVRSSVTYDLTWGDYPAGINIEALVLTGSAAINGTGNALDNAITGNAAANVLDGGAGADTMTGGLGDDTYIVDNASDKVIELSDQGNDTIKSSVTYAISGGVYAGGGTFVETLQLTGTGAINGTGNSLANTLIGNGASNILNGGAGADTMIGGAGDDTYFVDNAGDKVVELSGQGNDTIKSSVTYAISGGMYAASGTFVETLQLTGTAAINGTGNSLANTLIGNGANNILDGSGGADTMTGGLGDDTYVVDNVGDKVVEASGQGNDTVKSSVTYALSGALYPTGTFVENLQLTGAAAINGTGNSLVNTLIGNGAANVLSGLGGDDRLDGGAGADTLNGGAGADTFLFSTALSASNIDTIADFSVPNDTIQLASAIFAGLAGGVLNASAFYIGAGAHASTDRIIYNDKTGALLFDSDGDGTGAAIQFATLSTGLAMTNADFIVV